MDSIKSLARKAKQRLKSDFWDKCKSDFAEGDKVAKDKGLNQNKVKSYIGKRVQRQIKGEKQDEFYLKVKELLDTEGEVSNAIGRLTDKDYFEKLSYEEKQRYTLDLSARYLKALEKYRKEKELRL